MKVLIIGGGGREHAIVAKLAKSPRGLQLHAAPGNAGMGELAECHNVKSTDIDGIVALARKLDADWVFVAPDDPLVMGLVDELEAAGFKTFGPRKNAAVLEGSKSFSKSFMERYNIPTAAYKTFCGENQAEAAIEYIKARNRYPAVIKCDGLALGKGVIIAADEQEAVAAIREMMIEGRFGESGREIVIEEFLSGTEVTVLAFTDGKTIVPMPPSTDHKRAYDNDEGANTGGMGVVAGTHALPYYTEAVAAQAMERVFLPTIRGMAAEGRPFKGCLYFGLMLTDMIKAEENEESRLECSDCKGEVIQSRQVSVIEYNCRFGDPEAQAVLPLLQTDLFEIMEVIHEERLGEIDARFSDKASACVVMASGGYPDKYDTGFPIKLPHSTDSNSLIYHAGTTVSDGELVTAGGRVLGVVGVADGLRDALGVAYKTVLEIKFEGAHYRRDIGKKALE